MKAPTHRAQTVIFIAALLVASLYGCRCTTPTQNATPSAETGPAATSTASDDHKGQPDEQAKEAAPAKDSTKLDDDNASSAPNPAKTGVGIPISNKDRNRTVLSKDLKLGSGVMADIGRTVSYHYIMRLTDGTLVEDSHQFGEPRSVELGGEGLLPAIAKAVVGMRAGGQRRLLIPSYLAFGEHGSGGLIPPNADIDVTVEVFKVQ